MIKMLEDSGSCCCEQVNCVKTHGREAGLRLLHDPGWQGHGLAQGSGDGVEEQNWNR